MIWDAKEASWQNWVEFNLVSGFYSLPFVYSLGILA